MTEHLSLVHPGLKIISYLFLIMSLNSTVFRTANKRLIHNNVTQLCMIDWYEIERDFVLSVRLEQGLSRACYRSVCSQPAELPFWWETLQIFHSIISTPQ